MSVSPVNYIQHQQLFITHSMNDERLYSNDICLYFVFFYLWNKHRFHSPFLINRNEVMQLSHIRCRKAYMKSIKRLHHCGYIVYMKSSRQFEESKVLMLPLAESGPQQGVGNLPPVREGNIPHVEAACIPHTGVDTGHFYKLNINNAKTERVNSASRPQKKIRNENSKENEISSPAIPQLEEVLAQFKAAGFPEKEGRKFFFHYQAIGWTISGMPIHDWPSAAQKWCENIDSFTSKNHDNGNAKPGKLHVNEDKRYDIPL